MAGLRVHFVFPAGLVERVDAALTVGQSRGEFVREAVEQALGSIEAAPALSGHKPSLSSPAPAEQPQMSDTERKGFENLTGVRAEQPSQVVRAASDAIQPQSGGDARYLAARSSVQAKRDVRPVPKAKP